MKTKKFINTVVSGLLCLSLLSPLASTAADSKAMLGDINNDGKISSSDYIALRTSLLSGQTLPRETADINEDGKINSADYIALRLHILGIKKIVQPGERLVRTSISIGCSYKFDSFTVGDSYPDSYNRELTDGTFAGDTSSYSDACFVGFNSNVNRTGNITLDLGKVTENISAFEVSFLSVNDAGITPPGSIKVSVSDDNSSWKQMGFMKLSTSPKNSTDKAVLEAKETVSARYVRFTVTAQSAWVFIDEISVCSDLPESEKYDINNEIAEAMKNDITEAERQKNISAVKGGIKIDMEKTLVSISKDKKYTLSNSKAPFTEMKNDGKKLTDGNIGATFEDNSWVSLVGDSEQYITLDLGNIVDDISIVSLTAYLRNGNHIFLPTYVDIEASTDGKSYSSIARLYAPNAAKDGPYSFEFKPNYCIKTRYLRFNIGSSNGRTTLVSEVAAYAYRENTKEAISNFYPPVKLDTTDSGPWAVPTTTTVNLIQDKAVQIEPYINLDYLINAEYNTPVTSKILTDGKSAASNHCYDGTWFHCLGATGRYFYFDIGHVSSLSYVSGGLLHNSSWGISAPSTITVHLSDDGINWYTAGSYTPNLAYGERRENFRINFKNAYKARFVCFDMSLTNHMFIDELSAYGCKSTDKAVSLSSSGLKKFNKPDLTNNDSASYQAPSDDLLHGVNDVVLAYYANTKRELKEDYFRPYVGYIVDGKAVDTMFDGFLFLPSPGALIKGGRPDFESVKEEWEDLEDKLFIPGQNLDALNKAAEKVKNEIGLKDYKYKFFVSIAHPSMHVKSFGDIDGDGKSEDLTTVEARLKVVKWYVERFYKMYDPEKYPNLEFAGWYWFHESIDTNEGDPEVIKASSDYLRSIGDQLFWIPYYVAEGYNTWKNVGFDVCCMQPNFAFNEDVGEKRIKDAVDIIRLNNMCIEIEADGRALTQDIFLRKYLGYLSGGVKYGYMKNSIHMYYEAGGLYYSAYNANTAMGQIIYDTTYKFIKKTLTDKLDNPEAAALKCVADASVTHKVIEKDDFATVLITKSPEHGTVTVNGDGTVSYYPGKGYKGTDSFKVAVYDYIGRSEDVEITVRVD